MNVLLRQQVVYNVLFKASSKSVSGAMSLFIRLLIGKVDELRRVSGHSDNVGGEGVGGTTTPAANGTPVSAPASVSVTSSGSANRGDNTPTPAISHPPPPPLQQQQQQYAHSWSKKLESSDLGGRELVPAALRVLQAAGRLTKRLRELDVLSVDLLSELLPTLFRDTSSSLMLAPTMTSSSSSSTSLLLSATTTASVAASSNLGLKPTTYSSSYSNLNIMNISSHGSHGHVSSVSSIIDSSCALFASQLLRNNPGASAELKSFLTASTSSSASQLVFAGVVPLVTRLRHTAGTLLFDLCCAAPIKLLSELHAEDVWHASNNSNNLPLTKITCCLSLFLPRLVSTCCP